MTARNSPKFKAGDELIDDDGCRFIIKRVTKTRYFYGIIYPGEAEITGYSYNIDEFEIEPPIARLMTKLEKALK